MLNKPCKVTKEEIQEALQAARWGAEREKQRAK
jgi:hypothetical protein